MRFDLQQLIDAPSDLEGPPTEHARALVATLNAAARADAEAVRAWIAAQEDRLTAARSHLSHLLDAAERTLRDIDFDPAALAGLYAVRSFIAWLVSLSADGDWWADQLDTEEFDAALAQRADLEGALDPTQIPEGTPMTHGWWWAPGAPSEHD